MVKFNGKEYALDEALELFLSERRPAEGDSWAKPTKDDMELLYGIVYELLDQKFERDCDNDLPINFFALDRTRFQPLLFLEVPQTWNANREDKFRAIEMLSMLSSAYAKRLDTEIRCLSMRDNNTK